MKAHFKGLCLGAVFLCLPNIAAAIRAGTPGEEDPVKHCEKLSRLETEAYIDTLGKTKRFDALVAVYSSGTVQNYPYAAYVHAVYLDDDAAIALCTRFEIDSGNWVAAVEALTRHRRAAVIGYMKQAADSSNPRVRAACYAICEDAGWDDLMDTAKADGGLSLPPGRGTLATRGHRRPNRRALCEALYTSIKARKGKKRGKKRGRELLCRKGPFPWSRRPVE